MRINVPFLKQELDYTCGPTALQMVLKYFGKPVPEATLCALSSTTERNGTARAGMVRALTVLGFQIHSHHGATIDEVNFYLEQQVPLIMNYRDSANVEGHYGVAVGIEDGKLLLHDPYEEPFVPVSFADFDARWYGYHSKQFTRWMLAVSDKPLPLYPGHIDEV